jgi:hypothetical protein
MKAENQREKKKNLVNGIETQGLILARQVVYHMSHFPRSFLHLIIFWIGSHDFPYD